VDVWVVGGGEVVVVFWYLDHGCEFEVGEQLVEDLFVEWLCCVGIGGV